MADSGADRGLLDLLQRGIQYHQQGDLRQAELVYRDLIRQVPGWIEPRRLLGQLAVGAGKRAAGIEMLASLAREVAGHPDLWHDLADAYLADSQNAKAEHAYRQLLGLDPHRADARVNLGLALYRDERIEAATAEFREAIRIAPNFAAAHFNLGLALQALGQLNEAATAYEAAATFGQASGEAWFNLGCVRLEQKCGEAAVDAFERAIAAMPNHVGSHANLGKALLDLHNPAKAVNPLWRAVELQPRQVEAWVTLISALRQSGDLAAALGAAERAASLGLSSVALLNNHAVVLQEVGRPSDSENLCRAAIELDPNFAEAHDNLGAALMSMRRFDEAAACFLAALRINPNLTKARENLAIVHRDQGELVQAESCLREAIRLDPASVSTRSALLFVLQLRGSLSADEMFAEHRLYGQAVEGREPLPGPNVVRRSGRKLRVGYVSGDFRSHSVAYFFEPLLEHHDRSKFEVACYYSNGRADAVTRRIRARTNLWRECMGQSDDALAERIHADQIDILVDLSGHTGNNRLPAFALKPAPIQMTWLGYSDTTGLSRMDYRITDRHVSPPGRFERWHTEMLLRLPNAFLCYAPPADAPALAAPPVRKTGHITFGCFNYLGKVSDDILLAWAEILRRNPAARLLLKNKSLGDAGTRDALQARVTRCGIRTGQLIFQSYEPDVRSHLEHYSRVDIALDSFPYAGGTTTCEALWMGVPVVSRVGDSYVSRMGLSLLSNAGHSEWAAPSVERYVDAALTLADSASGLERIRLGQRDHLLTQPLFMPQRFARDMEDAYSMAWQNWCESPARQAR